VPRVQEPFALAAAAEDHQPAGAAGAQPRKAAQQGREVLARAELAHAEHQR
jgi:hypothetical protein